MLKNSRINVKDNLYNINKQTFMVNAAMFPVFAGI
jgi:hypothetical protein